MMHLLLLDHHAVFRQALVCALEREPDMTVVQQGGLLAEVCGHLNDVDIAILDLSLPDGAGTDLIPALRSANPASNVLVLTASTNRRQIARAIAAGATAYLHKSAYLARLIETIRSLGMGEQPLSTEEIIEMLRLAREVSEQNRNSQLLLGRLTQRERDVLQRLARGLTDRQIAQELQISTATARTHMVHILNKLGVESRLQALLFALRHGAVKIDSLS